MERMERGMDENSERLLGDGKKKKGEGREDIPCQEEAQDGISLSCVLLFVQYSAPCAFFFLNFIYAKLYKK